MFIAAELFCPFALLQAIELKWRKCGATATKNYRTERSCESKKGADGPEWSGQYKSYSLF
jgi:hypothetical protein